MKKWMYWCFTYEFPRTDEQRVTLWNSWGMDGWEVVDVRWVIDAGQKMEIAMAKREVCE